MRRGDLGDSRDEPDRDGSRADRPIRRAVPRWRESCVRPTWATPCPTRSLTWI